MDLPSIEGGHLPLPDLDAVLAGPPKRGRGRPKKATPDLPPIFHPEVSSGTGKHSADSQIREGLTRYYSLSALMFSRLDPTGYDTSVVLVMAEKCADAWLEVGHEYPEVYRALKLVTAQNAFVDLGFAHLAIGIGIAANHGVVPADWVTPFSLPVPNPQAAQAASVQMGQSEMPMYAPPPSPMNMPTFAPNPPRQDASPTGLGVAEVPGMQTVQYPPDLIQQITQQALQEELAQRARAAAQAQQATTGIPGYNPTDTAPRINQNPTVLSHLIQRRG